MNTYSYDSYAHQSVRNIAFLCPYCDEILSPYEAYDACPSCKEALAEDDICEREMIEEAISYD